VQTLGFTDLLIVPAGGVINGARRVCVSYLFGDSCRVELPPAFVERHPHCNARAVIQKLDHFVELGFVFDAAFKILAREKFVIFIAQMNSGDERRGNNSRIIAAAAVYHILPHEHSEPVAVIVPAQRLDLYVLAQHIKAHVLGGLNVKNERLIRRGGVHAVGPVALIEQTVVEIRLAI